MEMSSVGPGVTDGSLGPSPPVDEGPSEMDAPATLIPLDSALLSVAKFNLSLSAPG